MNFFDNAKANPSRPAGREILRLSVLWGLGIFLMGAREGSRSGFLSIAGVASCAVGGLVVASVQYVASRWEKQSYIAIFCWAGLLVLLSIVYTVVSELNGR